MYCDIHSLLSHTLRFYRGEAWQEPRQPQIPYTLGLFKVQRNECGQRGRGQVGRQTYPPSALKEPGSCHEICDQECTQSLSRAWGTLGGVGGESHGKHEEVLLGTCLLGSQEMANSRRNITAGERRAFPSSYWATLELCKSFLLKTVKRGGLCPHVLNSEESKSVYMSA